MTLLTELEAVNEMLAAIQEAPIASLTDPQGADATTALTLLRRTSREVQSRGWHWNIDLEVPMARLVDGRVPVPAECLRLRTAYRYLTRYDLTRRGGFVFDNLTRSGVFPEAPVADLMLLRDFEDVPEEARAYILAWATRRFLDRVTGRSDLHSMAGRDEVRALATLRDADADARRLSFLSDPKLAAIRMRAPWR